MTGPRRSATTTRCSWRASCCCAPTWSRTGPAPTPASTPSSPCAELLQLPGASQLQDAWLAALAGQPGYLAGKDAEVAACDAVVVPVVTGSPDVAVVDQMIGIVLAYLDATWDGDPGGGSPGHDSGSHDSGARAAAAATARPRRRQPRPGRRGHRHRPLQGAVARGVAGAAVRHRPPRHRPGRRPGPARLHLAPRPARRPLHQQARHPRHRLLRRHPRPHPPRRRSCAPAAPANGPAAPGRPSTATSTTCATRPTAARRH